MIKRPGTGFGRRYMYNRSREQETRTACIGRERWAINPNQVRRGEARQCGQAGSRQTKAMQNTAQPLIGPDRGQCHPLSCWLRNETETNGMKCRVSPHRFGPVTITVAVSDNKYRHHGGSNTCCALPVVGWPARDPSCCATIRTALRLSSELNGHRYP